VRNIDPKPGACQGRRPGLTDEAIEAVRALSPIEEVAGDHVSLRRSGAQFIGLCPFHAERSPSFAVNPGKQLFFCYGCGVGGDAFRFIQIFFKCKFPDAVRLLAQRAGLDLDGFRPSPELRERVARVKAQRSEEIAFWRFWGNRLNGLNRQYRSHCRAATWAEECLRRGILTSSEEHDLAWTALEGYRLFEARVEREGLCEMEFVRAEWQTLRGDRHAAA
jgi:hypothetical protein